MLPNWQVLAPKISPRILEERLGLVIFQVFRGYVREIYSIQSVAVRLYSPFPLTMLTSDCDGFSFGKRQTYGSTLRTEPRA